MSVQRKTDTDALLLSRIDLEANNNHQPVPITAIIRQPFECADNHWICAASISGLMHRKADLEGTTKEQAVVAARRFLESELTDFVQGGGQLLTSSQAPIENISSLFEKIESD